MTRGCAYIGLEHCKTSANLGSVLRAAGNFNAGLVAVAGRRLKVGCTDTMKAYKHGVPLLFCEEIDELRPEAAIPVAVELTDGARSLVDYIHPENAFYIFGPEDGSIKKETIKRCRDVVFIPTNRCLNLSGAVHCVLYDRLIKRGAA